MSACEPADIYRELKANDLNEWIWNGAGFSSLGAIFLITEKEHPLCAHVAVLPYELYVFVKFFERLGIKKLPDAKQLEHLLVKCVKHTHKLMAAKEHSGAVLEHAAKSFPLVNWIKANHAPHDKKLASIIKDYEESLAAVGSLPPFVSSSPPPSSAKNGAANGAAPSSPTESPPRIDPAELNASDAIFVYLPELYKSGDIKDSLISSVAALAKNRQIKTLDEETYLMRKVGARPLE